MKFIIALFGTSFLVMIYNYFDESNNPPRNLIKGSIELLIVISIVIFLVNRYFFLFR